MKFACASTLLAAAVALPSFVVEAFSGLTTTRQHSSVSVPWTVSSSKCNCLAMSDDDVDDWFSDYDPSAYERSNSNDWGSNDAGYSNNNRRFGGGGGRRGGGGGGGLNKNNYGSTGHDYTRDTSRDTSNVDEEVVNDLLAQRLRARKVGDFDTADAIRDELLKEHSVGVFDRDKVWRTGLSPSFRQPRKPQPRRNRNNFGPHGHDYEVCQEAGPIVSTLTESEIHEAIAERLQAKLKRDFETADRIQYGLVDAGVYINDGIKEWRADGVPFGDIQGGGRNPGRTFGSRSDRDRPYVQSEHSEELDGEQAEVVADMVQERNKYKQHRDYLNADSIRDDLKDRFNVFVDDRLREWSVGGDFGDSHNQARTMSETMRTRPYVKSTRSLDLPSGINEQDIQDKIHERTEAKKDRDYELADAIRDELMEDYSIVIHDKLKMWSVGGEFGDESPRRLKKHPNEYIRRGGGDLSGDDFNTICSMVSQRAKAKRDRNYDLADELRARLRDEFNVSIDDRSREWRIDTDDYVQSEMGYELGAQELTEEQKDIVDAKLKERSLLKREKNYDEADAIRDELKELYNVLIDDRTKEWKVVMAVGNNGSELDNQFASEAMRSQSSAFKQKGMDDELDDALDSILEETSAEIEIEEEEEEDAEILSVENGAEVEVVQEIEVSMSQDDLSSLTVVELKEKLRDSGMAVSGRKEELINRLLGV